MRLFAGDAIPDLHLLPHELPRPWVLPAGISREHRARLCGLLAQALRGGKRELLVVALRWGERGLLESGRLRIDASSCIIWEVESFGVRDAREVLRQASRVSPGLFVLDFAWAQDLPAQGWLGPLKLEVLRCVENVLLDRVPVTDSEGLLAMVQGIAETTISPVDFLDTAEELLHGVAEGLAPAQARARAFGRVIAARVPGAGAELAAQALVKIGRDGELEAGEKAALSVAGLLEGTQILPPLSLVKESAVQRESLRALAARHSLKVPLEELAPGLFSEEAVRPALPEWPSWSYVQTGELPAIEVQAPVLQEALHLLQAGDLLRAVRRTQHAETVAPEEGRAIAALYRAAAITLIRQDERVSGDKFERAAAWLERAANLLNARGEQAEAAQAFMEAGHARLSLGQHAQAEARFQRGAALAERGGDDRCWAANQEGLARSLMDRGETDQALVLLREQILPTYERLGDKRGRARTQGWIGAILSGYGLYAEAMQLLDGQMLPLAKECGDRRLQAEAQVSIAGILQGQGRMDDARRLLDEALRAFVEVGDLTGQANALRSLALNLFHRGEFGNALRVLREQVLPLSERTGNAGMRLLTLGSIADSLAGAGELDESLRLEEEEILPALERTPSRGAVAMRWLGAAITHFQRGLPGDRQRAEELLAQVRADPIARRNPAIVAMADAVARMLKASSSSP